MKQTCIYCLLLLCMPLGCKNEPPLVVKSAISSPETPAAEKLPQQLEESTAAESETYAEAYSLLFDRESRASKAIDLVLGGKNIAELGEKELNLLCWAYNELGDSDKQLEASRHLWERFPNGETSTHWICASLWNKHAYSQSTAPIFEFVSDAMDSKQGNARNLLALKASALVVAKDQNMTDAERRVAVSDLLVRALCAGPPSSGHFKRKNIQVSDSPDFFVFEHPFRDYFTSNEQDVLKLRMRQAKRKSDSDR